MVIESLVWSGDHWVKFRLVLGNYENIIAFLDYHNLFFLTTLELDFTQIPFLLHGKGNSTNLLQYLANNTNNSSLIFQFIEYFIVYIIQMKYYYSGERVAFNFFENDKWQNMNIDVYDTSELSNNYVFDGYIDYYFE